VKGGGKVLVRHISKGKRDLVFEWRKKEGVPPPESQRDDANSGGKKGGRASWKGRDGFTTLRYRTGTKAYGAVAKKRS